MIRRINLIGPPFSRKTTMAAQLFADLKKKGRSVHLIQEYATDRIHEGTSPFKGFDGFTIFAEQLKREERALRAVDLVVSESPLFLSFAYSTYNGEEYCEELFNIVRKFEKSYPSVNFRLEPNFEKYSSKNRLHNKEESIKFDNLLLYLMYGLNECYTCVNSSEQILENVEFLLKGEL